MKYLFIVIPIFIWVLFAIYLSHKTTKRIEAIDKKNYNDKKWVPFFNLDMSTAEKKKLFRHILIGCLSVILLAIILFIAFFVVYGLLESDSQ